MSTRLHMLLAAGLAAVLVPLVVSSAPKLTAREIMQRVDDRDDGDNSTMDMDMLLIDKRGKERVRQLRSYGKDVGPDTYSLLLFRTLADVQDTGFLTAAHAAADCARDQRRYACS